MSEGIIDRYPSVRGNALAMARLSAVTRQKGLYQDAMALGLAAVEHAPNDTEVRDITRAALSAGVAAFHSRMLRDEQRNSAYARAIARSVRKDMIVLEIGTGAGLLALMAARAGALVVTCEANPMIAEAAREIAARNGLSDRIKIIAKRSEALEIGIDLPERADLLIHEIFGDSLFNEGVVASVADARSRLVKPEAVMLPARAELRVALIADELPRNSSLDSVEGFDLSPFELLTHPITKRLGLGAEHIRVCSQPHSALGVDFTQDAPFGAERETLTIQSTGGRIDAVAQWLRIDLGSGESLENDPFGGSGSHWKAPLFYLARPIETLNGDPIEVMIRRNGTAVTINARRR
jgi:type II protein arginine methyltransferase